MKTILLTTTLLGTTIWVAASLQQAPLATRAAQWLAGNVSQPDFAWPPAWDQPYPDFCLLDQEGNPTRLTDFRGKIILVEPIGMSCPACQALNGGHQLGGFAGIAPQAGLPSLQQAARDYGGFDWDDERIVKIYLLLYNLHLQAPTLADAQAWARHFQLQRAKNEIVLVGLPSMLGPDSYHMIPGVQLIDQDMILRRDSTGRQGLPPAGSGAHQPQPATAQETPARSQRSLNDTEKSKISAGSNTRRQRHDLWRDLLPQVRQLLQRPESTRLLTPQPRRSAET